jgi:hypothetical protein
MIKTFIFDDLEYAFDMIEDEILLERDIKFKIIKEIKKNKEYLVEISK